MTGIVIVNYIKWNDTKNCIHSILNSEKEDLLSFCIYVVDNASGELLPDDIRIFFDENNIVLLKSKTNIGYAAGNNLGISRALEDGCDKILISNSDVCFESGCITGMSDYLDEHPKVGIVGPKILDVNNHVQKLCICRKTGLKEKYEVRTRLNIFFRRKHRTYFGLDRDYDTVFPVYAVSGCCFMISLKCAREVFPFDEGTFLYEEEYIVGIRMKQAGYETHYYPHSVIHHLHGSSTSEVKPFSYCCETVSELYYCRKYLHAKNYQIYPLFLYRKLKYDLKCIKNGKYRKYRKEFRRKIKDAWKGKYIHNA